MGIKYQATPGAEPCQILLHVRMLDKDNVSQQEALGLVGVNLIHGALFHYQVPDDLMHALLDDLSAERIEVDMIKFSGPEFLQVDHRLMSLKLVQLDGEASLDGPEYAGVLAPVVTEHGGDARSGGRRLPGHEPRPRRGHAHGPRRGRVALPERAGCEPSAHRDGARRARVAAHDRVVISASAAARARTGPCC